MARKIKEIIPNPLIASSVELRFTSSLKNDEVLSEFYKIFGSRFTNVTAKDIPREIKDKTPELKFLADYTIKNDDYSISFSNNVLIFETVGAYKLWENYFKTIKDNLLLLKNFTKIESFIRIGIRYISVFDTDKLIQEIVNMNLNLNYKGYKQEKEFFRANLKKDDIILHLQIAQNANVKKDTIEKKGFYLDIDAFQINNIPQEINDKMFTLINVLHDEEKNLFENIIKQNFLDTLTLVYK